MRLSKSLIPLVAGLSVLSTPALANAGVLSTDSPATRGMRDLLKRMITLLYKYLRVIRARLRRFQRF